MEKNNFLKFLYLQTRKLFKIKWQSLHLGDIILVIGAYQTSQDISVLCAIQTALNLAPSLITHVSEHDLSLIQTKFPTQEEPVLLLQMSGLIFY